MNLDCMTSGELWEFWHSVEDRPVQAARELFPERPKGYVRATHDLRNYAANKAVARSLRIAGNIERARVYERICDDIYKALPTWAKW